MGQNIIHVFIIRRKCGLIAFLPEKQLDEMVNNLELKALTPRTITAKPVLLANLESVRSLGYAVDDEEIHPGVRCIAAPIRNYRGNVIASLGISGPANRIILDNIEKYANHVKDIADQVSERLGYGS